MQQACWEWEREEVGINKVWEKKNLEKDIEEGKRKRKKKQNEIW